MLASDLAIRLQSAKPKAIEPIAAQKFLASLYEVSNDESLRRGLQKVAYSPKSKEKHADDDDYAAMNMFSAPTPHRITDAGTAIICIKGVIGKNLSMMEKCLGCTDIDDIICAMKCYAKDDSVKRVVLKINSGGGTTTGLEEAARYIFNYPKETIAFTDEDMGSAAYWLGSQCRRVVVTPSSSVGSCGIYVSMVDESKKFQEDGKEVIVIKSGDYKGAGIEGLSLTQKQGDWIQEEVDELHKRFIGAVFRARPLAKTEDLQGQSFYGDLAAQRGLVTGLVDSFDELMKELDGEPDAARTVAQIIGTPQNVMVRGVR